MSEQVEDYFIVTNPNVKVIEAEVKKLISAGWTPHGGLCGASGSTTAGLVPVFCQAMVKIKKEATEQQKGMSQLKQHKHSLFKNL